MFKEIPIEQFESRTSTTLHLNTKAEIVVSPRHLVPGSVTAIQVMSRDYLDQLIRNVTLEGDEAKRPYKEADIRLVRMDPSDLMLGQTFVERGKYQAILEEFRQLFGEHFCVTRGIAKLSPLIVFGKTADRRNAIAHYVPPIVEATNGTQFLLDGVHRNFLAMGIGTTIESVLIKGVETPLPCTPQEWSAVQVVNKKPPRERRFWNLESSLFRNLKYTGIDG